MQLKTIALLAILVPLLTLAEPLKFPLQLKEKSFNFKEENISISMMVPKDLHETYIKNPVLDSYTYSSDENRFQVNLQLINPSKRSYQEIVNGKFKEIILKPFGDKENNLYGEVEILKDDQKGPNKIFEYQGYLKKPQDGFTADLYSLIHEVYLFKYVQIIKANCIVQGRQQEILITKEIFDLVKGSCKTIIDSVKISRLKGK